MLELLLQNLINTGYIMGVVAIVWLSNFTLSLYYNIKLLEQPFEFARLKSGVLKLFTIVIGTGLLVVGVTLLPIFLQYVGLQIDDTYVEFFNVLAIIGLFARTVYAYTKQAYETLSGILDFTS